MKKILFAFFLMVFTAEINAQTYYPFPFGEGSTFVKSILTGSACKK